MNSYTNKIANTLAFGEWKDNRTGTRCLTSTPKFFEHDMREGFPLLTQKQVSFKMIAVELEAFISGITDKQWYKDRKCNIWNSWANPATTKTHPIMDQFSYDEATPVDELEKEYDHYYKEAQAANNDLGEYYGWCWRRFGQPYTGIVSDKLPPHEDSDYDQLAKAIKTLKTNPNDRRMIVTAWNPLGLDVTALPSCHLMFILQHINGKLSLNWTQRSVDSFLGLPYNIASYGLLLELIAKEVGMIPHMLTGNLVDFHIYENHIKQCEELLARPEKPLPKLELTNNSFWDWDYTQAKCIGYKHSGKLSAEVSV